MNWNALATVFGLVFLAEMGDKTQLAVITMTARTGSPVSVFLGASAALAAVTLLGVAGGGLLTRLVSPEILQRIAAAAFIVIGVVMLIRPD
jgi:putative Ca2+/H+ antiporter (TMEM165/GDT1 family)